jgi:hypothetical protein
MYTQVLVDMRQVYRMPGKEGGPQYPLMKNNLNAKTQGSQRNSQLNNKNTLRPLRLCGEIVGVCGWMLREPDSAG